MNEYSVSVIIVTYNSALHLKQCLQHLDNARQNIRVEIIVIDNCSTDYSATIAAQTIPDIKVHTNRKNVGFGAACNQGARIARGEFLLFLNPDMLIDSDSIESLLEIFKSGDRIGFASGRVRYPDGRFQPNCRKFPTVSNLIFSRGSVLARLFGKKQPYTLPDYSTVTIVEAVGGMMIMISRKLFDKVGRFDERYFMYVEDSDLSYRLTKLGYVNVFVPSAGGVHFWKEGSTTGRIKRLYYHHRSFYYYFKKHDGRFYILFPIIILLFINLMVKAVLPAGLFGEKG